MKLDMIHSRVQQKVMVSAGIEPVNLPTELRNLVRRHEGTFMKEISAEKFV